LALAHEFDYARPASLAEALELLKIHRSKAKILAGGTDLIVNIKEGMCSPSILIDIKEIEELKGIKQEAGYISIGALVSFSQILESSLIKQQLPMLWDAAATVASSGIRNRASLAGNLVSAVPSLDSAPPLLCYEALLRCYGEEGYRDIPISEWFKAPRKTALKEAELLTQILISLPPADSSGIYLKLGRYNGEDLAQAGWAIWISRDQQYRIAHCALAPTPQRVTAIENLLKGKSMDETLIQEAIGMMESAIQPITDIRSTREYRIHVSKVMLRRGLKAAMDRLESKTANPRALLGGFA